MRTSKTELTRMPSDNIVLINSIALALMQIKRDVNILIYFILINAKSLKSISKKLKISVVKNSLVIGANH